MKIKKPILFSCILLILFLVYLYIDTSIFFVDKEFEPIKVFFNLNSAEKHPITITTSMGELQVGERYSKRYNVENIDIIFKNPTQDDTGEIKIDFINFTKETEFWSPLTDGSSIYNSSLADDYRKENQPDILIFGSIFKDGFAPIWPQTWVSQPIHEGILNSPFNRTSFTTWETKYYFDTENVPFVDIAGTKFEKYNDIETITFMFNIPYIYEIKNSDGSTINISPGTTILTKKLGRSDSLHIVIEDNNKKRIKDLLKPFLLIIAIPMIMGLWKDIFKRKV